MPSLPYTDHVSNWQQESDMDYSINHDSSTDSDPSSSSKHSSSASSDQVPYVPDTQNRYNDSIEIKKGSTAQQHIPITNERQIEVTLDLPITKPVTQSHEGENRITTRSMKGITKPKVPYVGVTISASSNSAATAVSANDTVSSAATVSSSNYAQKAHRVVTSTFVSEPQSVTDALTIPHWKNAMKEELFALKKNNT